jgi:molybdopterin adenylyltransferase
MSRLPDDLRIAILTCSDTLSRGEAADTAGQALADLVTGRGWSVVAREVRADDHDEIVAAIEAMADTSGADVVFTAGGTGLGPKDVTPEATLEVCDRSAPGIAEAIRAASMTHTAKAMLSRAVAGIRGAALVINMPGSEKAARESFGIVADQLPHAVRMLRGEGHC